MKTAAFAGDPIERFLADAERAARRGDRELALELIVLALDTAPAGDPATLVRAHAIRAMLPATEQSSDSRAPTVDVVSPAPKQEEALVSFESSDDAAERLFTPLPPMEELQIEHSDISDTDVASVLGLPPPQPGVAELSSDDVAQEEEGRWKSRRYSRGLVYSLWAVLLVGLLGAVVVLLNPGIVDSAAFAVRRSYDPYARAEYLLGQKRYAEVVETLNGRIKTLRPEHQVSATLFLAEAYIEAGDTTEAIRELKRVLTVDSRWRDAMNAARLLLRAGAPDIAASAFLLAFERGAPLEEWEEIAAGLTAGGRTEQAQHIRQLLGYDEPEEVAPLDSAASSRSPQEDES